MSDAGSIEKSNKEGDRSIEVKKSSHRRKKERPWSVANPNAGPLHTQNSFRKRMKRIKNGSLQGVMDNCNEEAIDEREVLSQKKLRPILKTQTVTKLREDEPELGQFKTLPIEGNDCMSGEAPQIVNISFKDLDRASNPSKKSSNMMSKLALARRKSIENVKVQKAMRTSKVQIAEFELGSSQFDMPPLNYSDEEEMAKRSSIGSPDRIEMSR